MVDRFDAGPRASLRVEEDERRRWETFGLANRDGQDRVFREMARAVADLTTVSDETQWQPASDLLAHNRTRRLTESS